jgi:prevent-host-death family protein
MQERAVMASVFKQHCLALLDQVARTHSTIVVTKHGRPVARVAPLDEADRGRSTDGSVTLLAEPDEAYFTTGESWDLE